MSMLIEPETLRRALFAPDCVVLDCRFDLARPEAGRQAWRQGHIPGAQYAHLDADLSSPPGPLTGRHPLPAPAHFQRSVRAWGISAHTQVVAYDDMGGAMASRLWWLLRWLGHDAVRVLDGGLAAWTRDTEGELETTPCAAPRPGEFQARPQVQAWLDTEAVKQAQQAGRIRLLDARGAARFRGEHEPIDPIAGHIPGALNLPFEGNLDAAGRFLPPAQLRERFLTVLGQTQVDQVVHMCGSGVTACHNLLAMEQAGLGGSRLYPGSWSEWIRDPGRAVARGPE